MESGSNHAQVAALLLCMATVISACRQNPATVASALPDTSCMQSGDLVYRLGNGFYSAYFQDFSQREKRFSHTGILVAAGNGDSLYVIHAEADDITGRGCVRRERLTEFLRGASDFAVYRLRDDSLTRERIAHFALNFHHRQTPFDLSFDAEDSTAVYCTELILYCVNGATGHTVIRPRTSVQGKNYIAIDDTYLSDEIIPVLPEKPPLDSHYSPFQ